MKIAIIVPMHSEASEVSRALRSIDSSENYQIICVAYSSTEETLDAVKSIQKYKRNITISEQPHTHMATALNHALDMMDTDVDAFTFLTPNCEYLPGRLNLMTTAIQQGFGTDLVIGQIAYDYHGEWRAKSNYKWLLNSEKVTLAQQPEMLRAMTLNGKLFSKSFASLRFNEQVEYGFDHAFIIKAMVKASDIQLLPQLICGDNNSDTVLFTNNNSTKMFIECSDDLLKVRQQVMDILLLDEERMMYSYVVDEEIYAQYLQSYFSYRAELSMDLMRAITNYISSMQKSVYTAEALFKIVHMVERNATGWSKNVYELWRRTLIHAGIGRPKFRVFQLQQFPKKLIRNRK